MRPAPAARAVIFPPLAVVALAIVAVAAAAGLGPLTVLGPLDLAPPCFPAAVFAVASAMIVSRYAAVFAITSAMVMPRFAAMLAVATAMIVPRFAAMLAITSAMVMPRFAVPFPMVASSVRAASAVVARPVLSALSSFAAPPSVRLALMGTAVPVTASSAFFGLRGDPVETRQGHHQRSHFRQHGHRITPWLNRENVSLSPNLLIASTRAWMALKIGIRRKEKKQNVWI
ncbi:hypothetical protein [Singulisphaera acidiphila]|uniref:hypothetical protein n=1 Tax=Singulisphaera acidiphila TaxID=466153 RepID=UPI000382AE8D|nr:hypothetical protein [Singulisphaera acidiphila]